MGVGEIESSENVGRQVGCCGSEQVRRERHKAKEREGRERMKEGNERNRTEEP